MNSKLESLIILNDQESYLRVIDDEELIIDLEMYPFSREDYGEKEITLEDIKIIENTYDVKFKGIKIDNDDFGEHHTIRFSINMEEL